MWLTFRDCGYTMYSFQREWLVALMLSIPKVCTHHLHNVCTYYVHSEGFILKKSTNSLNSWRPVPSKPGLGSMGNACCSKIKSSSTGGKQHAWVSHKSFSPKELRFPLAFIFIYMQSFKDYSGYKKKTSFFFFIIRTASVATGGLNLSECNDQWASTYCFRISDDS